MASDHRACDHAAEHDHVVAGSGLKVAVGAAVGHLMDQTLSTWKARSSSVNQEKW